jgi:uncharacterized protein (TIGR02268 family)
LKVASYRSGLGVTVELRLRIPAGAAPYAVGGAKLEGKGQNELTVLEVWPAGPLVLGEDGTALVVVEAKAMAGEASGPFSLKLWEDGGKRIILLDKVTFP